MTDQNQALPAQGSDPNPQGEQNNANNNHQTMESLLNEQEMNVDLPQSGEIRTGVIASVSQRQILVSIGAKSEGVVSGRELDQMSAEERDALKVHVTYQVAANIGEGGEEVTPENPLALDSAAASPKVADALKEFWDKRSRDKAARPSP